MHRKGKKKTFYSPKNCQIRFQENIYSGLLCFIWKENTAQIILYQLAFLHSEGLKTYKH